MKAVSIGELAVDWLSLERGESMMSARHFYRYLGGNASNVAVGLARLGLKSAIISRVGNDFHGRYLLQKLEEEKVDVSYVGIDPLYPTAQCYMTSMLDGTPVYENWPNPNASKQLLPEHLPDEIYTDSWLWHTAAVTLISKPRRQSIMTILERAAGKIISFDGCFPKVDSLGGRQSAIELMRASDIIKLNLAELYYWTDSPAGTEIGQMVSIIQKLSNPAIIIITLAENGAQLWKDGVSLACPPYRVESVGDVGPGDAFSAGLIYGLSKLGNGFCTKEQIYDLSLSEWLDLARYGALTGALVTRSRSATESFPSLEELTSIYSKLLSAL